MFPSQISSRLLAACVCALCVLSLPEVHAKKPIKTERNDPPPENPVDGLLNRYDSNHDGQMDAEELKKLAANEASAAKVAVKFDRDGDGRLNVREVNDWRLSSAQKEAKKKKK